MKKRTILSAALAVLMLLALSPAAMATGFDLSTFDWMNPASTAFSLKDFLDGAQSSVSIAGTPVDLDHLLFVDCDVNEEQEICLCEATADARVLDETALPAGCRVEIRTEKLRRPDAKTGWDIVEENKRKAQGLSAEPEETPEPLPDDGQEHAYLYLVGKPTRKGSSAFLIWTDQFYYCSVEVAVRPDAAQESTASAQSNPFDISSGIPAVTVPTLDISTVTEVPAVTEVPIGNELSQSSMFDSPFDTPVVTDTPILPPPTVTITGSTTCRPGERAVLEARASGENLSYQWYMSLGYYSAPIAGATGSSFLPDTSQAGTYSYFCRVTSSAYGQQIYTDSETVLFNVVEKQLTAVSIDTMPKKLSYTEGETLDTTGLRLLLRYNDGSAEYATGGFTANPTVLNTVGNVNVLVSYKGFSVGYTVSVTSFQDAAQQILASVRGIGVLTAPYKTTYKVGETLNTDGLSIRAYTKDGNYFDVDWGLNCSPTRFSGAGRQTVTVTFAGKTCTFSVNVEQDNRITGLWIQNMPANRNYTVGDSISTSGLALQARTNSGTQTVTSGYSFYPQVASTPGTQTITVSYGGQTTTFDVYVREAQTPRPTATPYQTSYQTPSPYQTASPYATPAPYQTPSPYATPAPSSEIALAPGVTPTPSASPTPSVQPTYTPAPARRNTGVNGFVKVLFVVAVVALAALIAYVFYLRKHSDDEEDFDVEPRPSEKLHDLFNKKDRRDR